MADIGMRPTEAGMTLLEVIVALVILSFGLAALFDIVGLGTRTESLADQQRAATAAAQSLLAELGRSRPVLDGTSDGTFPTGQSWRLDIAAMATTPPSTGPLQAHQVHLAISWPDAGQARSVAFDTLVLAATP